MIFKEITDIIENDKRNRDFLRVKTILENEHKEDGLKCTLLKYCGFKNVKGNCFKGFYCFYKAKEELQRRLIKTNSTIEEIMSIEERLKKPLDYKSLISIVDFTKCRFLKGVLLSDNTLLLDENGLIFNIDTHELITLQTYPIIPLK